MKKGLEVFSYEQVAALRLFITSIVLTPFVFPALKKLRRKHYVPFLVAALLEVEYLHFYLHLLKLT